MFVEYNCTTYPPYSSRSCLVSISSRKQHSTQDIPEITPGCDDFCMFSFQTFSLCPSSRRSPQLHAPDRCQCATSIEESRTCNFYKNLTFNKIPCSAIGIGNRFMPAEILLCHRQTANQFCNPKPLDIILNRAQVFFLRKTTSKSEITKL